MPFLWSISRCKSLLSSAFVALSLLGVSSPALAGVNPFTEEAIPRGLLYIMQGWPQVSGYLGMGCGFADLDGDGDQDIIIIGAADGHVGIFENDGTGNFTDRSAASGIPLLGGGSAFAAGDYNADGAVDIYFTQTALSDQTPQANILMRNDGGFQFTDVTMQAGVGDLGDGSAAAWGDYSGDGFLDLYVCNYHGIIGGANTDNMHNKLYRNLGDGTFEDVSAAQGVDDDGYGFQAVWFDFDKDGDVDLYLSNDRAALAGSHENQLWRNDNGQLVNITALAGADVAIDSMGVACGDFDGNRWPDLYCTNVPGVGGMDNPLLLNQGNGTFVESGVSAGVDNPSSGTSWGSIFFDFDNDSHLDLYVNNMFSANALYTHGGVFPSTEVAASYGVVAAAGPSFAAAVADVDGDGDQDLLVNGLAGAVELFINHEGELRNWIRYRLVGSYPNYQAIGASVDTRIGADWKLREVLAGGNSYLSQNELTVHVGLGDATVADEVVVRWPGGSTTTLFDQSANQVITIVQPGVPIPAVSAWGMLIAFVGLLTAATILLRRTAGP